MEIKIRTEKPETIAADALVTYVFDGDDRISGVISNLDQIAKGKIAPLAKSGEITGKALEMVLLHYPEGIAAQRLLLVGAGKRDKTSLADLRRVAGSALRYLKARGVKNFVFLARENDNGPEQLQAVAEGLLIANFESDTYRSKKDPSKNIESVGLAGFAAAHSDTREDLNRGLGSVIWLGESQIFARSLINEPSNKLAPRVLAARAQAMAREAGLAVEILDEKKIEELKMGALLGVARGSVEPPRMIVLTYTPEKLIPGAPVLGLVGKAITFDTGGISIKPANDMEKMKYDMCGGAAMLGVMRALAR